MANRDQYQPQRFWEERLQANFNLRGVGHISFSESYNRWMYRRKAAVINAVFAGIDLKGKHVLDIGCGTGFFVEWYLRHSALLSGLDITEVSVRELSKRFADCAFRTQDITDSSYRTDASFDIVNMWDVVYHIVDDAALERGLDNICKSLKERGLFLFTDWFGAAEDIHVAAHVKVRSLNTYLKLLGDRGFVLVQVKPLYGMLNLPHLKKFDDHLGWLYYFLDKFQTHPSFRNLSVSLWRKQTGPPRIQGVKESEAHG